MRTRLATRDCRVLIQSRSTVYDINIAFDRCTTIAMQPTEPDIRRPIPMSARLTNADHTTAPTRTEPCSRCGKPLSPSEQHKSCEKCRVKSRAYSANSLKKKRARIQQSLHSDNSSTGSKRGSESVDGMGVEGQAKKAKRDGASSLSEDGAIVELVKVGHLHFFAAQSTELLGTM